MKCIVISAINFRSGGPLSLLTDCLKFLDSNLGNNFQLVALVHKKELMPDLKNFTIIEFPLAAKSYFFRIFYEYMYFKKISLYYKPYLWLSLHDMTPKVVADIKAVYCHNPSPFYKLKLNEFVKDPKFGLFNYFYKWVYRINIASNNYVVVQQDWMRKEFQNQFNLKNIIVAYPEIIENDKTFQKYSGNDHKFHFFYPAFPRIFKNFEVICKAVEFLGNKYENRFDVTFTIDGTENRYSRWLYNKFKYLKNIFFIGLQPREKIFEIYKKTNCLIFPSKLETWGLPLTEFKKSGKPIIVADLSYAHETIGQYEKVKFFDPLDYKKLANIMIELIEGKLIFDKNIFVQPEPPFAKNWAELFDILLKNKKEY